MTKKQKEELRLAIQKAQKEGASTEEILLVFASTVDKIPAEKEAIQEESVQPIERELVEQITILLNGFGIPRNIKGYHYIRKALTYAVWHEDILITKELYPEAAKQFGTTNSKVERAIRHAIQLGWEKGRLSKEFEEKPTNGEFLSAIADRLAIENKIR